MCIQAPGQPQSVGGAELCRPVFSDHHVLHPGKQVQTKSTIQLLTRLTHLLFHCLPLVAALSPGDPTAAGPPGCKQPQSSLRPGRNRRGPVRGRCHRSFRICGSVFLLVCFSLFHILLPSSFCFILVFLHLSYCNLSLSCSFLLSSFLFIPGYVLCTL